MVRLRRNIVALLTTAVCLVGQAALVFHPGNFRWASSADPPVRIPPRVGLVWTSVSHLACRTDEAI